MPGKKKPGKRRHNPSAYVNRGPDANRSEWWDEEDARIISEEMARSEATEDGEDGEDDDTPPIRSK